MLVLGAVFAGAMVVSWMTAVHAASGSILTVGQAAASLLPAAEKVDSTDAACKIRRDYDSDAGCDAICGGVGLGKCG